MLRSEQEIRAKIDDSLEALKDFYEKKEVAPEDFFTVARQATFMTALYWVLNEQIPREVAALAVPIVKKMSEAQAREATVAQWADKKDTPKKEDPKKPAPKKPAPKKVPKKR